MGDPTTTGLTNKARGAPEESKGMAWKSDGGITKWNQDGVWDKKAVGFGPKAARGISLVDVKE